MVKLLANEFGAIVVGWKYDLLDRPTMWFGKIRRQVNPQAGVSVVLYPGTWKGQPRKGGGGSGLR